MNFRYLSRAPSNSPIGYGVGGYGLLTDFLDNKSEKAKSHISDMIKNEKVNK